MHLRQAALDDAALLAALNEPVQQIHAEHRPDWFKPHQVTAELIEFYMKLLSDPACTTFIAVDDQRACGYMVCRLMRRPESPFTHAIAALYIDQLSINPEDRQRGIGALLMQRAVELARAMGIRRVTLDVWAFNHNAQEFFTAQGFTPFLLRMEMPLESV